MPAPNTVHVDAVLTDLAKDPRLTRRYIADEIYPIKPVRRQSDKITEIDPKGEMMRLRSNRRAPGMPARRIDFEVDTSRTYYCAGRSVSAPVTAEELGNADVVIRPYLDKTNFAINQLLLEKEFLLKQQIAADFTATNTSSPSDKWDDYSSGDPYADIRAKIVAIGLSCGQKPNRMALDAVTALAIVNHPDILDRIKYTDGGVITSLDATANLLAALFMLEKVVIADDLYYNAGATDLAAPSFASLWGEDVFLYVYDQPGIGTRATGVQFRWDMGLSGRGINGIEVERKDYDEETRSESVVAHTYYDLSTLAKTGDTSGVAGHLFTNTLGG